MQVMMIIMSDNSNENTGTIYNLFFLVCVICVKILPREIKMMMIINNNNDNNNNIRSRKTATIIVIKLLLIIIRTA